MPKPVVDVYARRILQKYRLHPNGWSYSQDRAKQIIDGTPSDTPPANDPLVITTDTPLPDGNEGLYNEVDFAATGGTPAYDWSVVGGSFPPGITMDAAGVMSGYPTAGDYSFIIQVADTASAITQRTFYWHIG